jgi:signal transduction histidine kinase
LLSAAFFAVGIFALCVWLKRRHEVEYLIFFNLAATSFVGHSHYYVNLPIANDWYGWLTANSLYWLIIAVHFFLRRLHGSRLIGFTRMVIATAVGIGITTLPGMPNVAAHLALTYGITLCMASAIVLVGGYCSWNKSREGCIVAIGVGFCALIGIPDWFLHNDIINPEGWFTGAYTNAITFGMLGYLMYRRYVNAIEEVERANANLVQRLREREAELAMSHRRLLEVELRQTISNERQRLMQDMHDGVGSSLISAIRSVERGDANNVDVPQILKDCLDDLKLTIDSMEPVEADLQLLLATLRFRLEPRLEDSGIVLHWEVTETSTLHWLDPSNALHVLRIVQECIANVLRHAEASEIRISTTQESDDVLVNIEDNGRGFDVEKALVAQKGRGLRNQLRRARAIEGAVEWTSGPSGTRAVLRLPKRRKSISANAA